MVHVSCLSAKNKKTRLSWARPNVSRRDAFWFHTVISDGKRFNLVGTDGNKSYWQDLQTDVDRYFKRQKGGGYVMYWGAIYIYRVSPLVNISGNMNFVGFCATMETGMIPYVA